MVMHTAVDLERYVRIHNRRHRHSIEGGRRRCVGQTLLPDGDHEDVAGPEDLRRLLDCPACRRGAVKGDDNGLPARLRSRQLRHRLALLNLVSSGSTVRSWAACGRAIITIAAIEYIATASA